MIVSVSFSFTNERLIVDIYLKNEAKLLKNGGLWFNARQSLCATKNELRRRLPANNDVMRRYHNSRLALRMRRTGAGKFKRGKVTDTFLDGL